VFLKPADSEPGKNANEVNKSGKRLGCFLIASRKTSELLHLPKRFRVGVQILEDIITHAFIAPPQKIVADRFPLAIVIRQTYRFRFLPLLSAAESESGLI